MQSEVSGITPSPENAQALLQRQPESRRRIKVCRADTFLDAAAGWVSRHHAHLEVEAGEADCVILLLFAFSLLKGEQSKKDLTHAACTYSNITSRRSCSAIFLASEGCHYGIISKQMTDAEKET